MRNKETRRMPVIAEGLEKAEEGLDMVMRGVARDTDRLAVLDAQNAVLRLKARFYNFKYEPVLKVEPVEKWGQEW